MGLEPRPSVQTSGAIPYMSLDPTFRHTSKGTRTMSQPTKGVSWYDVKCGTRARTPWEGAEKERDSVSCAAPTTARLPGTLNRRLRADLLSCVNKAVRVTVLAGHGRTL